MGLVASFVRNPVKVAVGVILLVMFGYLAFRTLPIQLVPEVNRPVISIETLWPGASPQEVEREIVQEQEEQLKGVEGVIKMSSESMDSRGTVTLEFGVGTDMASALLRVNTRLQQVPAYPADAREPVLSTSSSSDSPIAWMILRPRVPSTEEIEAYQADHPEVAEALEPSRRAPTRGLRTRRLEAAAADHPDLASLLPTGPDVTKMQRFAEDYIEARLERVSGISNANVLGGQEDELQVVVDPRRLAARGVTIQQLRTALIVRNRDTSAGDYWEGKRRYVVRTLGQFDKPSEIETVVVARRGGVPVYVRDVADVRLDYKKPASRVYNFGRVCLAVNAIRETGANVLQVMDGLKAAQKELNEGILKDSGLYLEQVYDETEYIESAIGLVKQNILVGGLLVFLVLLLFLRSIGSTLVVALAIPTSIIGTFLLLSLMNRSLNVISLAGLAFAVGMLVDNAVVVLENIYRHYQLGERRFDSAVRGTQEVWGAVVASTLTTLAVFIPIFFLKDEVGQLFGDIAIAISCAVGLSLFVSVTVIPTAITRVLAKRNPHAEEGAGPEGFVARLDAFVALLLKPLVWPLDFLGRAFSRGVLGVHRMLGWGPGGGFLQQAIFVGVIVFGALLLTQALMPKLEYLPRGNRNLAIAVMLPPPGYNLEEMTDIGQTVDERIRPYWDADPGSEAAAALPFPLMKHYFFVAYGRQLFLGAAAVEPLEAKGLVGLLNKEIQGVPGTIAFAQQMSLFEQGLTASRTVDIEIRGPDLRQLVGLGGQIFMQVNGMFPGAQARPVPSLDLSSPEVHVVPRWERAADLGVTAVDLGYTVDAFVDGAYAGDFFSGGEKIDLSIVGLSEYASRLQDLKDLPVATPSGNLVPIGTVADIHLSSGPEQINRRERERTITIQFEPPPTVALEEAIERVEAEIVEPLRAQGVIGTDYRIELGGTADKLKATISRLGTSLLLAVIITYLLMAALFESWLYPFIVILSVPLGGIGGLAGLWLLNHLQSEIQPLDTLTMIGFIILIGTVVNNAILIVHQALNNMREANMEPNEAVLESVRTRLRPIFMTLFTTVFGLAPLVLFPGAGSELYRGIGSILIGGLVVSTFFTLFLVPTLFRLAFSVKSGIANTLIR